VQPRDAAGGRIHLRQSLGHALQQQVALLRTQRQAAVAVLPQVDHQQALPAGPGLFQHLPQVTAQGIAVGDVQQAVMVGHAFQPRRQIDVDQAGIGMGDEHLQQLMLLGVERALGRQVDGHRRHRAAAIEEQHLAGRHADAAAAGECVQQQVADHGVGDVLHAAPLQLGEAAVGRGHHRLGHRQLDCAVVHAYQAIERHFQQCRQFAQQLAREIVRIAQPGQAAAGLHDVLQPALGPRQRMDLAPGPQRTGDDALQAFPVQVGLEPVLTDVQLLQGLAQRRHAGLPGDQHDAHFGVAQLLAYRAHQLQARVVGLHHHVQQDRGDAGIGRHHVARLDGR